MAGLIMFLSLVLCAALVEADFCNPGPVSNVSLKSNYFLYWNAPENPENCIVTAYVLNVFDPDDGSERQFQTTGLNYDMSFLEMCKHYQFEVHALTDNFILGPSLRINSTTVPTSDMNLNVTFKDAIFSGDSKLQLQITWNMSDPSVTNCISYYRLVYWDETNLPRDTYVYENNYSLLNLVSCMTYSFQISAFVKDLNNLEGPTSKVSILGNGIAPEVPQVINMTTTTNSVDMYWRLQPFIENRCKLLSLVAKTIGVDEVTVDIDDNINRPDVHVVINGLKPDNVYASYIEVANIYGSSNSVTATYQTKET